MDLSSVLAPPDAALEAAKQTVAMPATAHAHLGARSGGFLSCLWFEEARANMDEAGLESSSDDEELELLSGSSILSGSVLECRRGGE
eukprot:CAMPEP_0171544596 /NCGR_PEP_ID=MMETSP0960-20121227/3594_1 /TAXON_ID=87120 /ORGANISM="Aurantiochytrium limacinum, Strain ATCCMYA-1381" /LENGTH=86 /DNA_ID=CAMNT_0012092433 /DNA_START=452 /DNA_END=713 /DNA_ORIENTATION=+